MSGTTILTAVKNTVDPETTVVYKENPDAEFVKSNEFSYGIVVVGENPYAEMHGDNMNLTIPDHGPETIANVCGAIKCVVIVISGRPVVIEPYVGLITTGRPEIMITTHFIAPQTFVMILGPGSGIVKFMLSPYISA